VIVKPNFEGSSKGITEDSVVEEPGLLLSRVAETLQRYPQGVLVEEYVAGRDIFVAFLERASAATGGALPAGEYLFDTEITGHRRFPIYDYDLKHVNTQAVSIRAPAQLSPAVATAVQRYARLAFEALRVRDFGRIDFRVTDEGSVHLIDVDPLPSLRPGGDLYAAAAQIGLTSADAVLDAILRGASMRHGLQGTTPRHKAKRPLRVGFTFNLKRNAPNSAASDDSEAEYDSPKTVGAVRDAIASYGHEVIDLEATPELPSVLGAANVDVVFNIAEGFRGRNRESQVPALLELLDIPYTGSDPAALAITLDKVLAKRVVRQHGIATPNFVVMETGKERLPRGLRFPVIVKPAAEGSSKGVFATSVVSTEVELRTLAREIAARYGHPALVEEFLTGREFTVALLGERRPKALPPMEIVFTDPDEAFPVYTFEDKLDWSKRLRYDAPARVDAALGREIERVARESFAALGCRDVARIDLRLDAQGRVNFIECNPLPGLTPGWSDLCLISTAAGLDYRGLIGEILAPAIRRHRDRQRERRQEQARARNHG
jgi:D-alanine-D-alanine ligase